MSINIPAIHAQVLSAINEYGYDIEIYRDIYETDELGCKTLTKPFTSIGTIRCIIDNYSSGRQKSVVNTNQGVILNESSATLYAPYVEDFLLKTGDFVEYDDITYKVEEISDTLHYHLLYTISLKRVDFYGE